MLPRHVLNIVPHTSLFRWHSVRGPIVLAHKTPSKEVMGQTCSCRRQSVVAEQCGRPGKRSSEEGARGCAEDRSCMLGWHVDGFVGVARRRRRLRGHRVCLGHRRSNQPYASSRRPHLREHHQTTGPTPASPGARVKARTCRLEGCHELFGG